MTYSGITYPAYSTEYGPRFWNNNFQGENEDSYPLNGSNQTSLFTARGIEHSRYISIEIQEFDNEGIPHPLNGHRYSLPGCWLKPADREQ